MTCAARESPACFRADHVQFVLKRVDTALQIVKRHALARDVQNASMVRCGPGKGNREARWGGSRFEFDVEDETPAVRMEVLPVVRADQQVYKISKCSRGGSEFLGDAGLVHWVGLSRRRRCLPNV